MLALSERYKRLSETQAAMVKSLLGVHGNGVWLVNRTGLNLNTIKRAAEGLRVTQDNYDVLTDFIRDFENGLFENQ